MDIGKITCSDTVVIDIKDPLGNATDIKVVVYGADSSVYRNSRLDIARMDKTEDHEELAKRGAMQLAKCIKSWDNVLVNGQSLNPDKAVELLADPDYAWFTDQILLAIHDRKLFFAGLASN